MGAKFDNNSGGGWFDVEVETEVDITPFLSLTVENEDGDTIAEAVCDEAEEVEEFFRQVDRAREKWNSLKGN